MKKFTFIRRSSQFIAFLLLVGNGVFAGQLLASTFTPSFAIVAGGWHNTTDPEIAIESVGLFAVAWNDGQSKGAKLVYTSATGGTASGDYNGTFSFVVQNDNAWKIVFGNGSAWEADSGTPLAFAIASGGWHNVTDPEIAIESVTPYTLTWNDGQQKEMDLAYASATGGTGSGDYDGAFNFTVTNGIAWKVDFGNGSYWVADSGESTPGSNTPKVEILTPEKGSKVGRDRLTFFLAVSDADSGDSLRRITLHQGRSLVEATTSGTSISAVPKGKGRQTFTVTVYDQAGQSASDSVVVRVRN